MSDFVPPILTNPAFIERAWMPDNEVYLIDWRALQFDVDENGNAVNPRRILDLENLSLDTEKKINDI